MGTIWQSYPEVREGLGNAVNKSERYIGHIPHEGYAVTLICCYVAVLPDNRVLRCGHYAHSAGWWGVIDNEE